MVSETTRDLLESYLGRNAGILPLEPCYYARKGLPPGRRLGLEEFEYDKGTRGNIIARCIASETRIDNPYGTPDEGLSYLAFPEVRIALKDALKEAGDLVLGTNRASEGKGLNLLAKIFDFDCRLYFHVHLKDAEALRIGKNPKDEAYYFLEEVDQGPHPETFFGVHPYIVRNGLQEKLILPLLEQWETDRILMHSRAYLNVPGEGFHLPAGGLHAPGTSLTLELQEPSDTFSVFQGRIGGISIDKSLLYKDIPDNIRERDRERAALDLVDWELSGDPYFYENRRLVPVPIPTGNEPQVRETWVVYNSLKFSAKRVALIPGASLTMREKGAYTVLAWKGQGSIEGHPLQAGPGGKDEYLVSKIRAEQGALVRSTGACDLVLFKLFGSGVNPDVPFLPTFVS